MELGFCLHRVALTDQTGGSAAVHAAAAAAAAAGSGSMKKKTSTRQSRESAALADYLQQGTKRRRSDTQEVPLGKGKRREILPQPNIKVRDFFLNLQGQRNHDAV